MKGPEPGWLPHPLLPEKMGHTPGRCKVVHAFFVDGHMQKSVNDTAIELILKVKFSEKVRDYRLISLCIVVYKVVSKCLVNHLRPLLDNSISKNQSALIPNCLITENALIAFECIHAI